MNDLVDPESFPFKINGAVIKNDVNGKPLPMFHTHWAEPGVEYFTSNKTDQLTSNGTVTSRIASRYFSPVDLPLKGSALMLNRFDGAYGTMGNSYNVINPHIYRYFPYLFNIR